MFFSWYFKGVIFYIPIIYLKRKTKLVTILFLVTLFFDYEWNEKLGILQ